MNEHADRDQSEEPVDLTGFEDAYANAPHAGAGGQGDPVDEQRAQRYAEAFRDPGAFVERRRVQGVYPNSDRDARETLTEWQARAVMAVADAEMAALWTDLERHEVEIDRLQRWRAEASEVILGLQDVGRALGVGLGEQITGRSGLKAAQRLIARAEAAERALADERAKVARVEALIEQWDGEVGAQEDYQPAGEIRVLRACLADLCEALAGPEPEATEVVHMCPPGDEALTPCCFKSPFELPLFSSRMTVDPSLVTCGRPEATEGGA